MENQISNKRKSMDRFVRYPEGAAMYHVSVSTFMQWAKDAKACYKVKQWLREIMSYKKAAVRKVVFNQKRLDSYFEPNMSNEDIETIIVKLLDEWKEKGGQN